MNDEMGGASHIHWGDDIAHKTSVRKPEEFTWKTWA
jgi:hypothetical protein